MLPSLQLPSPKPWPDKPGPSLPWGHSSQITNSRAAKMSMIPASLEIAESLLLEQSWPVCGLGLSFLWMKLKPSAFGGVKSATSLL